MILMFFLVFVFTLCLIFLLITFILSIIVKSKIIFPPKVDKLNYINEKTKKVYDLDQIIENSICIEKDFTLESKRFEYQIFETNSNIDRTLIVVVGSTSRRYKGYKYIVPVINDYKRIILFDGFGVQKFTDSIDSPKLINKVIAKLIEREKIENIDTLLLNESALYIPNMNLEYGNNVFVDNGYLNVDDYLLSVIENTFTFSSRVFLKFIFIFTKFTLRKFIDYSNFDIANFENEKLKYSAFTKNNAVRKHYYELQKIAKHSQNIRIVDNLDKKTFNSYVKSLIK